MMNRLFKIAIFLLPLAGSVAWSGNAHAAACTSAASGNWSNKNTWAAPCNVVGGPKANDTVTIAAGHIVTMNGNPGVALSLVVNGTADWGQARTTNVGAGGITINAGGDVAGAGAGVLTSTGGMTINANVTSATVTITLQTTPAQTISGNGSLPNLAINAGVTATNTGTLTVGTALSGTGALANTGTLGIGGTSLITTLTATATGNVVNYTGIAQTVIATAYDTLNVTGTATNTGTVTVAAAMGGTGALTNAATGILNIGGTATVTTLDASAIGNVVNYTGAGQAVIPTAYDTLNVTGTATNTGTVTVAAALGGTGALTNAATGILNIGGAATLTTLDASAIGNVVNYTGAAQAVIPAAYDTLNVTGTATNSGTVTVAAALGGTGALTNAATGILNIGGTSTVTTLTASAIGNAVNYTGAAAQTVIPTAYYHLGLSGGGAKTMTGVTAIGGDVNISGAATMTGNDAFTIVGAFNYGSSGATTLAAPISIGSFNQSAGTLIDNGNTITVTGTGAGTWTQSGGAFTPTGTVIFTGAAPQIGLSNFNNLTISVGAGNTATLTGNATAAGVLTLTSGQVSAGANILEVSSNCVTGIAGASTTNYIVGNLRLHYPANAGATSCVFPIGDATTYAPATITMNGVTSVLASSSLTARTDPGDHADTTVGASGIDATRSVNRYWTLTPGASLSFAAYDTTFSFAAGDIDGAAATANFIIGRNSGSSWYYPALGAKNPTDTTATGMTQAGGFGEFVVGERVLPSITMLKTVAIYSDPVNVLVDPKFIPGAIAQYTVIASNSGGPADSDSTFIDDPVPANTALYVSDIGGAGSGPVLFAQGAASSTLTYTFTALNDMADDVSFSNDGGATWTAVPVADSFGCDATITHIRVNPKGSFAGSAVAPNPSFQLNFRVCVK